jgi:hypothetical protein
MRPVRVCQGSKVAALRKLEDLQNPSDFMARFNGKRSPIGIPHWRKIKPGMPNAA